MADHVAVSQVADHEVINAAVPVFHESVRDRAGAHGRRKIIGWHVAGRGNKDAVLAVKGLFHAAVEEIGHVGVLLRFREAQLAKPRSGDHLAQNHGNVLIREGNRDGQSRVVGCHGGGAGQFRERAAVEAAEVR